MRKRTHRIVAVVHALHHAGRAVEVVHELARDLAPLLVLGDKVHLVPLRGNVVHGGVHVAVGVAGKHDGLFPSGHIGTDALRQDGRAKHRAVQDAADGAVGALPHFMQVIFGHALYVGGNGRALDGNAQFLGSERALHRHGVPRRVAVGQPQVEIFRL